MSPKIKNSLLLNSLLFVVALVVGIGAVRLARQTIALRSELGQAQARLAEITRKQAELSQRLRESDSSEAIEREAKATLNLKNRGEEVVVVVQSEQPAGLLQSETLWQRIKKFFSGIF